MPDWLRRLGTGLLPYVTRRTIAGWILVLWDVTKWLSKKVYDLVGFGGNLEFVGLWPESWAPLISWFLAHDSIVMPIVGVTLIVLASFFRPSSPPRRDQRSGTLPPTDEGSPPAGAHMSWDFESFLGMTGHKTDTQWPEFDVSSFQATGWNLSLQPITAIDGYLLIEPTGEKVPIRLNDRGRLVESDKLIALPTGEWVSINATFKSDGNGIHPDVFLTHYTPFRVVVATNLGLVANRVFTREQCRELVQRFREGCTKPANGPRFKP